MLKQISNEQTSETKVYNPLYCTSANGFVQTLFFLHTEFERTKLSLQKRSNYYLTNLFSLLGYHYEGKVDSPNILHISAESWLLGVIGELKKEFKHEEITSLTYYDLLRQIKSSIVEENVFVENMKLLTGIYGIFEPALGDNRIFKMFLVNIQDTKNQIHLEETEKDKITRENFFDSVIRTLRIAFNLTLNEFNSNEKGQNLEMLNSYLDEKVRVHNEMPSFEAFTNNYFIKKGITDTLPQNEEKKLLLCLENYFNFCETTFADLLVEISYFNKNAASVMLKIKRIISVPNLKRTYSFYLQLVYNLMNQGYKNIRLDTVLKLYAAVRDFISEKSQNALSKVKSNYASVKNWINSTAKIFGKDYFVDYFKYVKNEILNNRNKNFIMYPVNLLNEIVLNPACNLATKVKDGVLVYTFSTYNAGKEKINSLKENILQKVSILFKTANDKLNISKYFNMVINSKCLEITVNKNLFFLFPKKIVELMKYIQNQLANFNPLDSMLIFYTNVKEKATLMKNELLIKYKNFLALADEDNCKICSKEN